MIRGRWWFSLRYRVAVTHGTFPTIVVAHLLISSRWVALFYHSCVSDDKVQDLWYKRSVTWEKLGGFKIAVTFLSIEYLTLVCLHYSRIATKPGLTRALNSLKQQMKEHDQGESWPNYRVEFWERAEEDDPSNHRPVRNLLARGAPKGVLPVSCVEKWDAPPTEATSFPLVQVQSSKFPLTVWIFLSQLIRCSCSECICFSDALSMESEAFARPLHRVALRRAPPLRISRWSWRISIDRNRKAGSVVLSSKNWKVSNQLNLVYILQHG